MRRHVALLEGGRSPAKGQVAHVKSLPAPVGGWNVRDPLAAMSPLDAVALENWFPRQTDVVIRNGCTDHATGFGTRPTTLALHTPPVGTNRMFASNSTGIYEVTSAGAIGATVLARTEGYHNWTQMGVSGGHYLMMFNGIDKPAYYEGTTWTAVDGVSTPAITGITTTDLVSASVFKHRLMLLAKGKLSFYYLPVDSVGGAIAEFPLGPVCNRGGYAMATGNWSFDGGDGPEDYFAIITSEGEVIVFAGTNPADPANWAHVGTYVVGKPIGRKCLQRFGGDLIAITEFGVFPMSKVLQAATVDYRFALTNKIEGAFNEAGRTYSANVGWEAVVYPRQSAIVVNIPTSATTSEQYVMNTITRSWCKFTGWNSSGFAVFNGELYFCDATRVAKAWTGRSDYGLNISASAKTAYSNFGSQTQLKHFTLFRPMLLIDGALSFAIGLSIDFKQAAPLSPASSSVTSGAVWDTDLWDTAFWASGLEVKSDWESPSEYPGYWAAGRILISTNSIEVQWAANDYLYKTGGVVG